MFICVDQYMFRLVINTCVSLDFLSRFLTFSQHHFKVSWSLCCDDPVELKIKRDLPGS